MNPKILIASLALVGAWAFPPQDADAGVDEQPLRRVPGLAEYAQDWAADLRSEDLERRRRAYEEVLEGAARSGDVRELVEEWRASADDLELAWTAELLLRELRSTSARPDAGGHGWPFGDRRGFGFGPDAHGDLFRRLEEMFPRDFQGFNWDPDSLFGRDPFGSNPLRDLDSWSQAEGMSLQIGPDGVRVELRETVDGEEKVTTYEAESMDALLEAHPELEERIGRDHEGAWERRLDDAPGFRGLLRQPFSGRGQPPFSMRPSQVRTDVLGVRVRVGAGEAGSVGLEVVDVVPEGLADRMGIRAGETVLAVDGTAIATPEDVRRVLAERDPEATIEVRVRGLHGETRVVSWEPPAPRALVF